MLTFQPGLLVSRPRQVRDIHPRCAACGYPLRGLPSAVCPECGSNLSLPRSLRRGGWRPAGGIWRGIAWTWFVYFAIYWPVKATWLWVIEVIAHADLLQSSAGAKSAPIIVAALTWLIGIYRIVRRPILRGNSKMFIE